MFRASRSVVLAALTTLVPLAVIGLAGCTLTSEHRSAEGARAEVRAFFDRYVEALNRSDSTGVLAAYAPDSQATLAGRERFFRGPGVISRTAGEGLLPTGQNTFHVDTLEVFPIERVHALALVVYTVDPADQDIPAFHVTGTYVLRRTGAVWHIIHAHVCPAREM